MLHFRRRERGSQTLNIVVGPRPITTPLNLVDTGELDTETYRTSDQGIKKVFKKIRERGSRGEERGREGGEGGMEGERDREGERE